jgi:hypothetical protein
LAPLEGQGTAAAVNDRIACAPQRDADTANLTIMAALHNLQFRQGQGSEGLFIDSNDFRRDIW